MNIDKIHQQFTRFITDQFEREAAFLMATHAIGTGCHYYLELTTTDWRVLLLDKETVVRSKGIFIKIPPLPFEGMDKPVDDSEWIKCIQEITASFELALIGYPF